MKRFLYYFGLYNLVSLAGLIIPTLIFSSINFFTIFFGLILFALTIFLTYLLIRGIDRLDDKKFSNTVKKEVIRNVVVEKQVTKIDKFYEAFDLVRDCLNFKSTEKYPKLRLELKNIWTYLNAFTDKIDLINNYILDTLILVLTKYKEIINSEIKNLPEGIEIIEQTEEMLKLISEALGKIYKASLEGKEFEITAAVQALKSKLSMDGYINNLDTYSNTISEYYNE